MKHKLLKYKKQVDKTHKGLGNLFSFCLMNMKARKVAIIVAVSGAGKTTAIEAAAKINPDGNIIRDSVTRSGLKNLEKELTDYRGTFVIDPDGVLRYVVISDLSVGRSVGETLRVLKALQSGELCPVEWKPGEKTLGKA